MPTDENERALLEGVELQPGRQTRDRAPDKLKKIGEWTIVAFILNRTIGSGIFLLPGSVLSGTGCVGGALCIVSRIIDLAPNHTNTNSPPFRISGR
jgi:hypothetical protein